jgi:hypothetical protein
MPSGRGLRGDQCPGSGPTPTRNGRAAGIVGPEEDVAEFALEFNLGLNSSLRGGLIALRCLATSA